MPECWYHISNVTGTVYTVGCLNSYIYICKKKTEIVYTLCQWVKRPEFWYLHKTEIRIQDDITRVVRKSSLYYMYRWNIQKLEKCLQTETAFTVEIMSHAFLISTETDNVHTRKTLWVLKWTLLLEKYMINALLKSVVDFSEYSGLVFVGRASNTLELLVVQRIG